MLKVRTCWLEFAVIHGDMYEENARKERWRICDEGRKFVHFDFLYTERKVGHTRIVRKSVVDIGNEKQTGLTR